MSLHLFSPAKINLFLRVIERRPDGYHHLSSVFQAVSLGDHLSIHLADEDKLTCQVPHLPCDHSNLIWKAINTYRHHTGWKACFHIQLNKKIPMEAGLGGGSSNAATALWACNQLYSKPVPVEQLMQWGSLVGSDVPFFFSQGSAYCTKRGEQVRNIENQVLDLKFHIIKPPLGLSTAKVFQHLNFNSTLSKQVSLTDLTQFKEKKLKLFNDLEKPSFLLEPQLKNLKDRLKESGFETVLMTGSGSAFFCIGQGSIPTDLNLEIYPVKVINRSVNEWY